MGVRVFTESQIRKAIFLKAPIQETSGKRSPHKTGWLVRNEIKIDHLRVPNDHSNEFKRGKAGALAKKLKLTNNQYNDFVKCDLNKDEYNKILDDFIKNDKKSS